MRRSFLRSLAAMLVGTLLLGLGLDALAGPAAATDLLVQAYSTLAVANHDYKGHRVAAMKQIQAAGKELGIQFRGDRKLRQPQGLSDVQLRAAQGLLIQARASLVGKPRRHVNQALKHIAIALSLK